MVGCVDREIAHLRVVVDLETDANRQMPCKLLALLIGKSLRIAVGMAAMDADLLVQALLECVDAHFSVGHANLERNGNDKLIFFADFFCSYAGIC